MITPDDDIKLIITRVLTQEATAEEEAFLKDWRLGDPSNERTYQEYVRVHQLTTNPVKDIPLDLDVDQEWSTFVRRVSTGRTRTLSVGYALRIAAAVVLMMVGGYALYQFGWSSKDQQYVAGNRVTRVSLPDGSAVTLNRNAVLVVPGTFGSSQRTVNLQGEAFFEVQRDSLHPFQIAAGAATVEVLGTSFNVRAVKGQQDVEVVVSTGLVRLAAPEGKGQLLLKAGQAGSLNQTTGDLQNLSAPDPNTSSWRTLHLEFLGKSLSEVVAVLNRTYEKKIILVGDVPPGCLVTATFDQQSQESVLKVLASTLQLTVTDRGDRIEVVARGCQ